MRGRALHHGRLAAWASVQQQAGSPGNKRWTLSYEDPGPVSQACERVGADCMAIGKQEGYTRVREKDSDL